MPDVKYIVTFELNRESVSHWFLDSLDQLPEKVANWANASDYNGLSEDCEATDVTITGVYEVAGSVSITHYPKPFTLSASPPNSELYTALSSGKLERVYAEAQVLLDELWREEREYREAEDKKREQREFERLKSKYGKESA